MIFKEFIESNKNFVQQDLRGLQKMQQVVQKESQEAV